MFYFDFSFISGFMLGFELVSSKDLVEGEGLSEYLVIDLFIVRFLITYTKE
jgi:hypothetical protein